MCLTGFTDLEGQGPRQWSEGVVAAESAHL